jgi:CubicO group peptidase (beta-lactamase class C family)
MNQAMKEQIDAVFASVNSLRTPGAALAIVQDGEITYAQGYGSANLETNTPITSKTIFDIGSTSKQFTAFAVLLLARQGKLSLEDEVQKFLPDFQRHATPLTVRHLVQHTGGVRDYLRLMHVMGLTVTNEYPAHKLIRALERQRHLEFTPGERWNYSNGGYVLLGEIVARVSGQPLEQFVAEHLLAPLGMKHSKLEGGFHSVIPNRAMSYQQLPDGTYDNANGLLRILGDGSLQTTVEDLALWVQNFEHNIIGGYGQDFIDEAFAPGTLNNGESHGYGFGLFSSETFGERMIGHSGSWAGYLAELIFFPAQRLSVICLSNCTAFNPMEAAKEVAAIVLEKSVESDTPASSEEIAETTAEKASTVEHAAEDLNSFVGSYRDPNTGLIWAFSLEADGFKVHAFNMGFALEATGDTAFKTLGAPVQIEFIEPGKAKIQVNDDKPTICERLEPITYSETELRAFTGKFYAEELEFICQIEIHESTLLMRRGYGLDATLTAVARDSFDAGGVVIDFHRDAQGNVTGFEVGKTAEAGGNTFVRL